MKISFLLIAAVMLVAACNAPKEEDNVPTSKVELLTSLEDPGDTAKVKDVVPAETATNNNAALQRKVAARLLTARGSEPGWYAEFFADHVSLLLDYGKDTIKVDHDFSTILKDKTYATEFAYEAIDKGKSVFIPFAINIESKPCTEMSGDKRDRSITLKYQGKTYKGCAFEP